jgi:hypothetical protein
VLPLSLKPLLTKVQLREFIGDQPSSMHVTRPAITRDTTLRNDVTGEPVMIYVTNVYGSADIAMALHHLKTVRGDVNRPNVLGKKISRRRVRADGSISNTTAVPRELIRRLRAQGIYSDILGFMDRDRRNPGCRKTAWTRDNPEILHGVMPVIRGASEVLRVELPDRWLAQLNAIGDSPDFQIGSEPFSTMTVNLNLPTAIHVDEGDLKKGFGVSCVLGKFKGCAVVLPRFGIAVDLQPGSLLLFDSHEAHGNLPLTEGERVACVLYCRAKISQCGSRAEEGERFKHKIVMY